MMMGPTGDFARCPACGTYGLHGCLGPIPSSVPAVEAEMSGNRYTLDCRAIDCGYWAMVNSDALAREARAVHEEAHPEHNVWIHLFVVCPIY